MKLLLDVVLVHAPVINRNGEIIGSAVTNLDIHDIARACCSFGVDTYWIVTPFAEQQKLSQKIVDHWCEGYGKKANSDRAEALSLIKIVGSLDEVIDKVKSKWPENLKVVATCAKNWGKSKTSSYAAMRQELEKQEAVLLLFGTAWGLATEVFEQVDAILPPITGRGEYNHLSVRSAVSIILDRLVGQ
jgi:hypothetical protein